MINEPKANQIAQAFCEEHNLGTKHFPWEAFSAWIYNNQISEPTKKDFQEAEENYYGSFRNATELAEQICDECGTLDPIPESLRYYFDYEAYGRDLLMGGDFWQENGFYFRNN